MRVQVYDKIQINLNYLVSDAFYGNLYDRAS